jgi:hypothetical protein
VDDPSKLDVQKVTSFHCTNKKPARNNPRQPKVYINEYPL